MERFAESLRSAAHLAAKESSGRQDFYKLPERLAGWQTALYIGQAVGICLGLSWLFYQSLLPGSVLLPAFCRYYYKRQKKGQMRKRQQKFREEFRELAMMLSSLLLAGYSVENAMLRAYQQWLSTRGGQNDMTRQLACMLREIRMGESAENVWMNASRYSPIEEIRDFGQIFRLSKRSGAPLPDVLRRVARQLEQKIQTEAQIETMIAGKKTEQKVMNLMPAGILAYICMTSADMMRVMYTTWIGRLVMTGCLAVYLGAFCLSDRMSAHMDRI